jgi:hypothetical protein
LFIETREGRSTDEDRKEGKKDDKRENRRTSAVFNIAMGRYIHDEGGLVPWILTDL